MKPEDREWFSDIEKPVLVDSADDLQWDMETDIAVVGAGAAGASAAIEAADNGARVTVFDRFPGGGASAMSGGIVYLGGGTRYQKQAGYTDTPDNMFNYLKLETRDIVSDTTLREFCEGSVQMGEWLEQNGVPFEASMSPVKTFYPTNRYFLYYSGNELVQEYAAVAEPAPRGHRVKWNGFSGKGLMHGLLGSCRNKRVDLQPCSRVMQLVQDKTGTIVGLKILQIPQQSAYVKRFTLYYKLFSEIRMFIQPLANKLRDAMLHIEQEHCVVRLVRVKKGVILAAGGFIFNREMVRHHAPKYAPGAPLGSPGCNGNGIRLGESVGGITGNMGRGSAWRFINPPKAWVQGIAVNRQGQRFVNEESYGARIGEFMSEENDGKATLIFNASLCRDMFSQLLPGKVWLLLQTAPALLSFFFNTKKAATLDELALKCGLPANHLQATMQHYNDGCDGKHEDAFGKSADHCVAMKTGPYYAMDISLGNKIFICPVITLGGLLVDEATGLVKKTDDSTFSNLYAVGRNAVGVASRSYVSGLSLADCVFSGRRAGRHLARRS